jgi:nicotinate phosphoribosyltransferase
MGAMHSSALLTDLYELTMAYAYWKNGIADREATFHVVFRSNPFGGGYAVACGLADALAYLEGYRFDGADLDYLAGLSGNDGRPLFETAFLRQLEGLRPAWSLDAVPEGTVVFPLEPLARVQGPILQAQLLETALLNILNFQTLVATKAARICEAARGDPVVEFGLRRAQGPDGGLSASRAAYVGGCVGTSNTLAGRRFGIPVKGTHAHSWVMAFDTEREAFQAWARAMPGNSVFLVDTYDTLRGVEHAVEAGQALRREGHLLAGIRLDSGDLAWLSREARRILDEGGFPEAVIMASNELDEYVIESLKLQGAAIGLWGVGTHLATGAGDGALGGVYKLSAVRDGEGQPWRPKVKVSEQPFKTSVPGVLQVRRYRTGGWWAGDLIYDVGAEPEGEPVLIDPADGMRRKRIPAGSEWEDLLAPCIRNGRRVGNIPGLEQARQRTRTQLDGLHPGIRRFRNPHGYPVGLESSLYATRLRLIAEGRGLAVAVSIDDIMGGTRP